jgi:hypothetical protein
MSVTELDVAAAHCLRQTCVNDSYVVSTIQRLDEIRQIDGLVDVMTALVGDIGRADLSAAGDFETMVFPGSSDGISSWTELDFRRYDTEEEALEGHKDMVTKWLEMPVGLSRNLEEEDA